MILIHYCFRRYTRSLGLIEDWAEQLSLLQGTLTPRMDRVSAVLFAGSHGVAAADVPLDSPFAVVTFQGQVPFVDRVIIASIADGHATSSSLAAATGMPRYRVVDVGVGGGPLLPGFEDTDAIEVIRRKVADGTRNFRVEPAMSREECEAAMEVGRAEARICAAEFDAVTLGEAGIGNTCCCSAILTILMGWPESETVNYSTTVEGLPTGMPGKLRVVSDGVARARRELAADGLGADPVAVLSQVGGFEIAAMTGFLLEAQHRGLAVVLDGFIVTVAALVAVRVDPECRRAMFFSHPSEDEPCGPRVLAEIGADTPLSAHLRLGEGTGALLAWPLLRAAAALMNMGHRETESSDKDGMMERMTRLDPQYMTKMRAQM